MTVNDESEVLPFGSVAPPRDHAVGEACRQRLAEPSGLGRLRQLAAWVAGAQGQDPPRALDHVQLVTVAAPPATSTGALVALAELHGVRRRDVDLSDLAPADLTGAVGAGVAAADQLVDAGADLLVPVCSADPDGTVAASLVAMLLGLSALDVVGVPPGTDDEEWARVVSTVRDVSRHGRGLRSDPLGVLRVIGDPPTAALTGLLVQAAVRRTPVLLDGPLACAAALLARRLSEGAQDWWLAAQRSGHPAQHRALDVLGLEPLLDLGIGGDDGLGALTALGVLRAAVAAGQQ